MIFPDLILVTGWESESGSYSSPYSPESFIFLFHFFSSSFSSSSSSPNSSFPPSVLVSFVRVSTWFLDPMSFPLFDSLLSHSSTCPFSFDFTPCIHYAWLVSQSIRIITNRQEILFGFLNKSSPLKDCIRIQLSFSNQAHQDYEWKTHLQTENTNYLTGKYEQRGEMYVTWIKKWLGGWGWFFGYPLFRNLLLTEICWILFFFFYSLLLEIRVDSGIGPKGAQYLLKGLREKTMLTYLSLYGENIAFSNFLPYRNIRNMLQ